jgi:biopolymer transport protein ExbD
MRLRPRDTEPASVDLTALIDVVFLLLIFFMVSTTFQKHSELAIELPKASASAVPELDTSIEVSIDSKGVFYVNGRQLVNTQAQTLLKALTQALAGEKSKPLVIVADNKATVQSQMTILDVAQQMGLSRIRFATQISQPGAPGN